MSEENGKLTPQEAKDWQPVIRELIKHENELANHRIGWLIQMQGLLFAALAFAWEKAPKELTILLSILGIASAISIWSAIKLYSPAVRGLKAWWSKHRPDGFIDGPEVIGMWAPSSGTEKLLRPWRALPFIFVAAWVGVLIIACFARIAAPCLSL